MKFPFIGHAQGDVTHSQDPSVFHMPRQWQTGNSVSARKTTGFGDSLYGNGSGAGEGPDDVLYAAPVSSDAFFFLLCPDINNFEAVIINSICRTRP